MVEKEDGKYSFVFKGWMAWVLLGITFLGGFLLGVKAF